MKLILPLTRAIPIYARPRLRGWEVFGALDLSIGPFPSPSVHLSSSLLGRLWVKFHAQP